MSAPQSQSFSIGQVLAPRPSAAAPEPVVARTFTIEQVVRPRMAAEVAVRIDNVVITADGAPVTA